MKKLLLYSLCALSLSSCQKYLDVNDNPNNPTEVPARLLLPTTTLANAWANGNALGRAASILVQYNAGLAGDPDNFDAYKLEGSFSNQWNSEIYTVSVTNLRTIIQQSQASDPAYAGVAKLQLAYIFSIATDLFGDVPYSQAGYGLEILQPRYDKQRDIYLGNEAQGIQSLFNLVREGIADLDKPSVFKPNANDDLAYAGDLAKWKKMGNTMLLKLAMQVSNVAPDTTRSVINSVIAGNNYINNNSLDYQVAFKASSNNQNPMYAFDYANRPDEEMLSSRFLNLMKGLNDTLRLAKYYTKPATGFRGYNNGDNVTAPAAATRSRYGTYVVGEKGEAPVRMLTNFQTAFILAESAVVFGTPGNADSLYKAGIRASMSKVGLTTGAIDTFFTNNPTVVTLSGTAEQKREQILTQKYIAWVGNGIEAYNDYRRTGYPRLSLSLNVTGDDPTTLPKRFPYDEGEALKNPHQPNPRPRTNEKVWWGL
ncbi:SusD/RagB family nutrient-binding outer membrane lipoprotein [Paraflavisolibacter sp. H34]|uniref:SusD/RagB family nutrient-binding outer membrane lipoprotein n=1 Tax=Huijunlia imazamoxiresistens TaxID=3127457 RepID=UPI00301B1B81